MILLTISLTVLITSATSRIQHPGASNHLNPRILPKVSSHPRILPNEESHHPSGSSCPDHWIDASHVGLGCLYFDSVTQYAWDGANNFCQVQLNGTLLGITAEEQLKYLKRELHFLADHEGARSWWTSGTDAG